MGRKHNETENQIDEMYLNFDNEQVFYPESGVFMDGFSKAQEEFLYNCMNNRISIRAIAYPFISLAEMQMLVDIADLKNHKYFEVDAWKVGQTPVSVIEKTWILNAARYGVNLVDDVPNITKCQSECIRIASIAATEGVDLSRYMNPKMTSEKLQKILDKKLKWKSKKAALFKKCRA